MLREGQGTRAEGAVGAQDACIHLPQGWIHVMPRQMACPFLTLYGRVSHLKPPGLEQRLLKVPPLSVDLVGLGTSSTSSQDPSLILLEGSTAGNTAKGL